MLARVSNNGTILDIPFRGGRNYVHSTDLFAALTGLAGVLLPPQGYLQSLILRRRAQRQVEAHFEPHSRAFGTFALSSGHRTMQGWLVERGTAITRRIAFDETAIARAACVEPGRVFLSNAIEGYSGFEQMIVLFKILCARAQPGPWLFTALELAYPLSDSAPLSLTLAQAVLNRMIVAELHQDGRLIGRAQMVLAPASGGVA